MQLSDNISLILQHPQPLTLSTLPEPHDPTFLSDLKKHLDQNLEYKKARIAWRKTRPGINDLFTVKEQFFEEFCEKDLPVFYKDIYYFIRDAPDISPEDGAKQFCARWKGYAMTYGEEFVRRAIVKFKYDPELFQLYI